MNYFLKILNTVRHRTQKTVREYNDIDGSQNCASYMEKPELERGESKFVGLFNQ